MQLLFWLVFTIILVLFGLVVVWFTNPHFCLDKSDVKDKERDVRWKHKPLNASPFIFFPHPLSSSSSLKVPAVSLPSFQRMTPSPMTPVTQTAAAARATTLTRRRSCWMNRWSGRPALPMPTVQPRPLAPCSGLLETPPARGPQEALPPAPQHQLVSGAFVCFPVFLVPDDSHKDSVYNSTCYLCLFLSQQAPQAWYTSTLPTCVAPALSAPVLLQQRRLWRPATRAAIWHLPAVWPGPTALSSGRSQTSWVWFPSTTI